MSRCAKPSRARANILVAGGTSTGKTTLTNALLAEVAKHRRIAIVIIEDTRELQCAAPNLVAMRTKDGVATLSDLVRSSLRLRPDRIPIGEVRGSGSPRPSESLGHRPSGRDRHHPRRHRASVRCVALNSSFKRLSSPFRAP